MEAKLGHAPSIKEQRPRSPPIWETAFLSSPLLTTHPLASHPHNIPSKSSMVFSSLATDRSANSARVSACQTGGSQLVQELWYTAKDYRGIS